MKNEKMANAKSTDEICKPREAAWRRALGEMSQWAQEYGSSRLRRAIAHGYTPIWLYVRERLRKEWPEGWKIYKYIRSSETSCPTEAALDVEEQVRERIAKADWPMSAGTRITHDGREIIVVDGYLGQKTIFRFIAADSDSDSDD